MLEHARHVLAHVGVAPQVGAKQQVLLDRQGAEEAAALRYVGDALADERLGPLARDVLAGERDCAGRRPDERAEHAKQGRLPRPVGAHERDELAGGDVEVDAEQHRSRIEAGREVADGEQRFGARVHGPSRPGSVRRRLA